MSGAAAAGRAVTVIKLGGSFALSPHLAGVLNAMAAARAPFVLVPGGGPFADAVRDAQQAMGFPDRAAHRMALLAMAQFAEAVAGLAPRFEVTPGIAAVRAALAEARRPVWSPWPLADGLEHLPESWQLTSDSLAAWLAGRLGASRLLLLKHRDPPDRGPGLEQAAQAGIVDPLFPGYARQSGAHVIWLGPAQFDALTDIVDGRRIAGCPLPYRTSEALPA